MATPAQVANDLAAQAGYWAGRNDDLSRDLRQAAHMVRQFLSGAPVDGRTYRGLQTRLSNRLSSGAGVFPQAQPSLRRGIETLRLLRAEALSE